MKKVIPGKLILLSLTALLITGALKPVRAYIYNGEEPTSQLIVDKRIKTTAVSEWQDNLPASQITLKESDLVEFEIVVKNTGDTELKNIDVKDYLPSYLKFIFGPQSPENQEINWKIEKLDPGEEQAFQIRTQIEGANQISEGTFCLINKVRAEAESGEADEDTASFCILGAQKLPQAGANKVLFGTFIASLIAITGVSLRKFGRGEILS